MDLNKIMKQAQAMQKKMEDLQAKLADTLVTGAAGGGMVKITMNGRGEAKKVEIDTSMLSADNKEVVEDLVVAAINNAKNESEKQISEAMGKASSELGIPPGFKLPF